MIEIPGFHPRIWLPAYTALPVYVFVLYGVGNEDALLSHDDGLWIKIRPHTSPLELLFFVFFVFAPVLRLLSLFLFI